MKIISGILLSLLLLISLPIQAENKWGLPDSHTGKALTSMFETIESGDDETIKSFVLNNFDDAFLNNFSMDDHLSFIKQLHNDLGSITIVDINKKDQFSVDVVIQGEKDPMKMRLSMTLDEQPPHKIGGLGLEPVKDIPVDIEIHDYDDSDAIVDGSIGKSLDSLMNEKESLGFSGAVIVVKDGKTILHNGYGYTNREKKYPNSTRTVFDVASYAKSFMILSIMKLEERGKLNTSDPITKFFDNVPDDKENITIDHLLRMRSGLETHHDPLGDFEAMDKEEALKRIFSQKLKFEPGTESAYSNSGFSLLAAIIEEVSGMDYINFIRGQFFMRAGLKNTGFYQDSRWKEENTAVGYDAHSYGDINSPIVWPEITWACVGNGCLVSSPGDLGQWLNAIWSDRILSKENHEKLYSTYMKPMQSSSFSEPVIATAEANDFGFTACSFEFPDSHSYVIVTANSGLLEAPEVGKELTKMLFGE